MEDYFLLRQARVVQEQQLGGTERKSLMMTEKLLPRLKGCQHQKKSAWHIHAKRATSSNQRKLATRSILVRLIAQMSLAK